MAEQERRRSPHHKAYLNGRDDAARDLANGITDRDLLVRARYAPTGMSGAFARRWRRGYEEVRHEWQQQTTPPEEAAHADDDGPPTRFTLVRYRPDSLRDECRNIGLVAWDAHDFADRLIDGLPAELAEYARTQIARLRTEIASWHDDARIDQRVIRPILEGFDGPYAAVLFRHETGSSTRDYDLLVNFNEIWGWLFDKHTGDSPYGRWVWHAGLEAFDGTFIVGDVPDPTEEAAHDGDDGPPTR